jgi:hypothetical protein
MPSYGDALSPGERWRIVLFIRDLQQKSTAGSVLSRDTAAPQANPAPPPAHN